jgi:hypothetical protein
VQGHVCCLPAVAVKRLFRDLRMTQADAEKLTQSFINEAELLCRLRHPNCVNVLALCPTDLVIVVCMCVLEGTCFSEGEFRSKPCTDCMVMASDGVLPEVAHRCLARVSSGWGQFLKQCRGLLDSFACVPGLELTMLLKIASGVAAGMTYGLDRRGVCAVGLLSFVWTGICTDCRRPSFIGWVGWRSPSCSLDSVLVFGFRGKDA